MNSATCRGVRPSHPPHLVRRDRQTMSPDDVPIEQPLQNALHVPPVRAEIPEYRDVAEFRPFLEGRQESLRAGEPLGESTRECTHHVDLGYLPCHVQQRLFEPSTTRFPHPSPESPSELHDPMVQGEGFTPHGCDDEHLPRMRGGDPMQVGGRQSADHRPFWALEDPCPQRGLPRRHFGHVDAASGSRPARCQSLYSTIGEPERHQLARRDESLIQRHLAPEMQVQNAS